MITIESARHTTGSSARRMGHGTTKTTTHSEKTRRLGFAKFYVLTGAAQVAHDVPISGGDRYVRFRFRSVDPGQVRVGSQRSTK
jgi:hypothetical protein